MIEEDAISFEESNDEFKKEVNKLYDECIALFKKVPMNVSFGTAQALMLSGLSTITKPRRQEVLERFIASADIIVEDFP